MFQRTGMKVPYSTVLRIQGLMKILSSSLPVLTNASLTCLVIWVLQNKRNYLNKVITRRHRDVEVGEASLFLWEVRHFGY